MPYDPAKHVLNNPGKPPAMPTDENYFGARVMPPSQLAALTPVMFSGDPQGAIDDVTDQMNTIIDRLNETISSLISV